MIVRSAIPTDAEAIATVHVRSWQAGYRGLMADELLDGLSAAERVPRWRDAVAGHAEPGLLLVAEHGTGVAGFCAVAEPSRDEDADPDVAEIGAIYVDPDHWRVGVGAALMEAALEHLGSGDWREVTLWVLEDNDAAIAFYERFGFAPDGAENFYEGSGTTGIRLRRRLDGR